MTTLLSWNVNGMRAVLKSGFLSWLEQTQPDILCVQESRALPTDLKEEELSPFGYTSYWNPAQKKGYSGTMTYTRIKPKSVSTLGVSQFDDEGRVQVLDFDNFTILNGYWPNSQAERARLDYKLDYCKTIAKAANKLVKDGKNVLLCGDFNIAHTEIDLARPKDNENNAGYYIEERDAMSRFLKQGYVDTFRHFTKDPDHYTWWSYRTQARKRNIGWRIDYWCTNADFLKSVKKAWIEPEVMGSDHCPVGIKIG
ncbi:MAG: exodeoxyribonuclease III [Candidatus Hydrogenedentes bacterium]|nr:exodeoxyribonuclease III [Candidatus Hydrogenedentota bacterium]